MRIFHLSLALGVALIAGLSGIAVRAQDQPAAGAPPPAATSPTPQAATSPAPPAEAQPQYAPDPVRQARMLARRLALTPEQQSSVEAILAERQKRIENVRSNPALLPRERQARVHRIFEATDSRIKALLNETQKQLYEQMKQDRKARRREGGAPPDGPMQNQN